MTEFHFLRPLWLLAWIPLMLALGYWYRRSQGGSDWAKICDEVLLPHLLLNGTLGRNGKLPWWLGTIVGALAILAAAGPTWERQPMPAFRNQSALVIALELSPAVDATDLRPSRLTRLRYAVTDLLKRRKDGQTALLVYGGDAFTVTPLTDDVDTIDAQLPALSSDLVPATGHDAGRALTLAAQLLRDAGFRHGDILLAAVRADPAAAELAAELHGEGFRISVLGVGTEAGAPIPLRNGGFRKGASGEIELSRMDAPALRELAAQGGGRYLELNSGAATTDALTTFFEQNARRHEDREAASELELWEDRGPWLLLLVLPLAALGFRRGWLAALVLALPWPDPAHALDWQGLWKTPDQRAAEAFEAGRFDQAATGFHDPAWKSAAEYRAGKYEEAARALEGLDGADAAYNRGNALAKAGRLEEALEAYEQAERLAPDDEDIRHNRAVVEEALKRREQQKQPSGSHDRDQNPKDDQQQDPNDRGRDSPERRPDPSEEESRPNETPPEPPPGQKDGERQTPEPEAPDQTHGASPAPQSGEPPAEERETQEKPMQQSESQTEQEKEQATEQWLKRIPDDPGGLLRRKFLYQYRQRQQGTGGQ